MCLKLSKETVTALTTQVKKLQTSSHLYKQPYVQCCCQGLETQGQGQGQGLDVQGRGQGRGVKLRGQGLTPALIHTWFCMCNMNKRRAVAAQTARSRVNLYTHCLGTIDIPGQVVYLSRSQ